MSRPIIQRFSKGNRVRVDIPDETDPDHQEYHGEHGQVVAVLSDDADSLTADERDALLYWVEFDSDETADFRWRDLRPPIDLSNVLALSKTHHAAFDRELFTIDQDYRLRVDPSFETQSDELQWTLIDREGERISIPQESLKPQYVTRYNESLESV